MIFKKIKFLIERIFLKIRNLFIKEKQKSVSSKVLDALNLNFRNLSPYYNNMSIQKTILALVLIVCILIIILYYSICDIKSNISSNMPVDEKHAVKIVITEPEKFLNNLNYDFLEYKIKKKDTLLNILTEKFNISYNDSYDIIKSIQKVYNIKNLKVGQLITLKFRDTLKIVNNNIENFVDVKEIIINDDNMMKNIIIYKKNNNFYAKTEDIKLNLLYNKYFVNIKNGLYVDAINAGIPPDIIMTLINYYSFDIDFQRDIRSGDTIEVVFEAYYTEKGKKIKNGNIIFSNLYANRNNYNLYRLEDKNKTFMGYFDQNGLSTEKSLLKTPINGARISSGFNLKRKHPVLGYTKEHKAIDFAAPIGTPFYAAGSGKILKITSNCQAGNRRCGGGFGNYIQIKHNDNYITEYAHALKISQDLRVGSTVKQGQIIAYVGNTGITTGPHLHYGIIYKGERINPNKIRTIPSKRLKGSELLEFFTVRDKINNLRSIVINQTTFDKNYSNNIDIDISSFEKKDFVDTI